MINLLWIVLTVFLFKMSQKLTKYPFIGWMSPILTAGVVIILLLKMFHVDYYTYKKSASFLTFLLAPATIALGYPLYKNLNMLVRNKRVVYTAFIFAVILAILSTNFIGNIAHAEHVLVVSMLPKSVTAPIAIEVSKNLHGVPELTACTVVLTGVFGAIFGHKILKLIGVKNDIAIGLAIGAASHVLGTSKCIETGKPKQIVMSTLALVVVGILTVIAAPIIVRLIY